MITSQYQVSEDGTKSEEMIFMYNESQEIVGVNYDGYNFYYIKNAMGDVIGFIDELENTLSVRYYDAWGNHASSRYITKNGNVESSMSASKLDAINPMRYKGYYYDADMNGYYLQSRYYMSYWYRFLNADLPEYAKIQKDDYAGTNLFTYCNNDPVNNSDPTGYYSASRAQAYAERWWSSYNPHYKKNDKDCANFVSQCLYAGNLSNMTKTWYHKIYSYGKGYLGGNYYTSVALYGKISPAWGIASNLYNWLKSNHFISTTYTIKNRNDVDKAGKYLYKRAKCSAVLFFDWTGDNKIDHAALSGEIVNYKKLYDIYFYAHTSNRNGKRYLNGKRQYTSIKDAYNNQSRRNMIVRICILR